MPRSRPSRRASKSGVGRRRRWSGEDGGLIAGHARVLAARQLGIAEIPVMVAAGLDRGAEAGLCPGVMVDLDLTARPAKEEET